MIRAIAVVAVAQQDVVVVVRVRQVTLGAQDVVEIDFSVCVEALIRDRFVAICLLAMLQALTNGLQQCVCFHFVVVVETSTLKP